MDYSIRASSKAGDDAELQVKKSIIGFGTADKTAEQLPNPAELFLGSFAACILKNIERFSKLLHYSFEEASIEVTATRYERPPRMDNVFYVCTVYSNDKRIRPELLKLNLENFGTIYNTVKAACSVDGIVEIRPGKK